MVGKMKSAQLGSFHLKRFSFTFLFIPIYFGRCYVVRRDGGGWEIAGWLSGKEEKRAFGTMNVLALNAGAFLFPAFLWLLGISTFTLAVLDKRDPNLLSGIKSFFAALPELAGRLAQTAAKWIQ
ncbi:hypothetical protein [Caulobacter sp. DWR1-3-2b1]|uniref:hypothetical protein n=1 Tax=Caulobacter sp. DWR1-3-2b1 TaxID=2804670 RepID=UPI003CF4E1C7